MQRIESSDRQHRFADSEIIVRKTDLKGWVAYVNDIFCRTRLYEEGNVQSQPHSSEWYSDLSRTVFHLLRQRIQGSAQGGAETFAHVKNMARNGFNYWVPPHVTPSHGLQGRVVSFHSKQAQQSASVVGFSHLPSSQALCSV